MESQYCCRRSAQSAYLGQNLKTIQQGNATLYAPCSEKLSPNTSAAILKEKLGADLLTQTPEIAHWLSQNEHQLDLAAIAYLDGEKHVRVSMAMDSIMQHVSQQKSDTSLMFMCTPTDVYAVPKEVITASRQKFQQRSKTQQMISKTIATVSGQYFFKKIVTHLLPQRTAKSMELQTV